MSLQSRRRRGWFASLALTVTLVSFFAFGCSKEREAPLGPGSVQTFEIPADPDPDRKSGDVAFPYIGDIVAEEEANCDGIDCTAGNEDLCCYEQPKGTKLWMFDCAYDVWTDHQESYEAAEEQAWEEHEQNVAAIGEWRDAQIAKCNAQGLEGQALQDCASAVADMTSDLQQDAVDILDAKGEAAQQVVRDALAECCVECEEEDDKDPKEYQPVVRNQ